MNTPVIIVHGGAWNIPDEQWRNHLEGVHAAASRGMEILRAGGTALDAVEAAIVSMEDNPIFDAGIGSVLARDGRVQLDAALMRGTDRALGCVACVETVKNPIRLARAVLEDPEVFFLVGPGADAYARERGFPEFPNAGFIVPRERAAHEQFLANEGRADLNQVFGVKPADTVGALALDAAGHIVAGVSTGGTSFKRPGRVGDSPLPGCGYVADDEVGAACCTGWGEYIARSGLATRSVRYMAEGLPPEDAVRGGLRFMTARVGGAAGAIALDRHGRIGAWHTTPRMAWAGCGADGRWAMPEGL